MTLNNSDFEVLIRKKRRVNKLNKEDHCARLGTISEVATVTAGWFGFFSGIFSLITPLNVIMVGVLAVSGVMKGLSDVTSAAIGCPDPDKDKYKHSLQGKINENNRRLDRNSEMLEKVSKQVSEMLLLTEKTRKEMKEGFDRVIKTFKEQKFVDLIIKVNQISDLVELKRQTWLRIRDDNYVFFIEELNNRNELYNLVSVTNSDEHTLYNSLLFITDPEHGIFHHIDRANAFDSLLTVAYGIQIYIEIVLALLDQNLFLAIYYHSRNDFLRFNFYFNRFKAHYLDFTNTLFSQEESLYNRVLPILKNVVFSRYMKEEQYENIKNETEKLKLFEKSFYDMEKLIISDSPVNNVIIRFPENTANNACIATPFLNWIPGYKVSYAFQYENNGTFSSVSDWSEPMQITNCASPLIKVDSRKYRRFVYRKLIGGPEEAKPQLVKILETSDRNFRDIDRNFYNLAKSDTISEEAGLGALKILHEAGANISAIYEGKRVASHAAAKYLSTNTILRHILETNASLVHAKDREENTPLHLACEYNRIRNVKLLIRKGADVNAKNNRGITPLHFAVSRQFTNIVEELLKNSKIDVNAPNNGNYTPLHFSILSDIPQMDIIENLLSKNEINQNVVDEFEYTPLNLAVIRNLTSVVKKLLGKFDTDLNIKNKYGLTPIHYAAKEGYLDLVNILLSNLTRIDVFVKDEKGWTALHYAVHFNHIDVVRQLVTVNSALINDGDNNAVTPVHVAAAREKYDILQFLIERGALLESKTLKENYTPLHLSVMHNDTSVTNILLNEGVAIESRTVNGSTPLHLAAYYGRIENFKLLQNNGSSLSSTDNDGNLPFHRAISGGSVEIVKHILTDHPQFINTRNYYNFTPLYFSIEKIDVYGTDIYDYIKEKEGGSNFTDSSGTSFLTLFAKQNNLAALDFLIDEGAYNDTAMDGSFLYHFIDKDDLGAFRYILEKNVIDLDRERSAEKTARDRFMCRAKLYKHLDIVDYLKKDKIDLAWCDLDPLYKAVSKNNITKLTNLVKDDYIDINRNYTTSSSVLICDSISKSYKEIALFLIQENINLNVSCEFDRANLVVKNRKYFERRNITFTPPLLLAMFKGETIIFKKILEHIDPNKKDLNEFVPLSYAAFFGDMEDIKLLVGRGADVTIRDKSDFYTPALWAASSHQVKKTIYFMHQIYHNETLMKLICQSLCKDIFDDVAGDKTKYESTCNGIFKEVIRICEKFKDSTPEELKIYVENKEYEDEKLTQGYKRRGIKVTRSYHKFHENKNFLPNLSTLNGSTDNAKFKRYALTHGDINSALLLMDLFVRKYSNQKYSNQIERESPFEQRSLALKITRNLEQMKKLLTIKEEEEEIDFFDVYSKLLKAIRSGHEEKTFDIVCSLMEDFLSVQPSKLLRGIFSTTLKIKLVKHMFNPNLPKLFNQLCIQ